MTITTTERPTAADDRVVPEWELCDRLRRSMRMVQGLDNSDMAEILGVAKPTVSTWLGGRRTPSRATLLVWADVTGCDPHWLIHGDELRARRDSNPKPSDLESWQRPALVLIRGGADRSNVVKVDFTPDERAAS